RETRLRLPWRHHLPRRRRHHPGRFSPVGIFHRSRRPRLRGRLRLRCRPLQPLVANRPTPHRRPRASDFPHHEHPRPLGLQLRCPQEGRRLEISPHPRHHRRRRCHLVSHAPVLPHPPRLHLLYYHSCACPHCQRPHF